ncbi:MAG: PqqD family protein [Xanthobacteraceae bacterium]
MSVTADTILVRDSEPTFLTLEENVVLLSVRRGAYFSLNRVGTQIWNMLVEPHRVGDIFDVLAQTHDVDTATVTGDVAEFLETLVKRQLVRVIDPDGIA